MDCARAYIRKCDCFNEGIDARLDVLVQLSLSRDALDLSLKDLQVEIMPGAE
jgi:hypothetical protein